MENKKEEMCFPETAEAPMKGKNIQTQEVTHTTQIQMQTEKTNIPWTF